MSANICNICGANLIYKDGKWVCPACGAYKTEEISNEEVTLLYNAAQKLRLASFDDAEEAYRDIIAKYPENSEGHWGLVLSKYGIKYEDDYDGKKLPTCYATSIESILADKDYLDAVRLCKDKYQKEYYIEQGKVLEKIRVEWLEKASKEPKYDVFLCFKDSDKQNNMERTDDSIEVANLYTHLSSLGYKVFYSRESLRDKVAEKYEPYIYNALNTAAVMIVYGSKIEYFSSVWMKNEWTRYVRRLREGLKIDGSLVVACDGVNPAELPRPLNQMQVLDARKKTFYGDLEAHIAKIISIARRPKVTVERVEITGAIGKKKASVDNQIKTIKVGGNVSKKTPVVIDNAVSVREIGRFDVPELSPDEDTKLKSVNSYIKNELFDNAKKVVDEILEKNKYNGQALLADLLITYKVKSIDELTEKLDEIEDFSQFNTVIEYNDKEIGEKLIAVIGQKIRLAIANSNYDVAIAALKEIVVYNSTEVLNIRLELRNTAKRLLSVSSKTAAEIFDVLLNSYRNGDTYIEYIQGFVEDCLATGNFTIAQKYNDKIIELDDGNLKATFAAAFISVRAKNAIEFVDSADKFVDFKIFDDAIKHFDEDEIKSCFDSLQNVKYDAKKKDIIDGLFVEHKKETEKKIADLRIIDGKINIEDLGEIVRIIEKGYAFAKRQIHDLETQTSNYDKNFSTKYSEGINELQGLIKISSEAPICYAESVKTLMQCKNLVQYTICAAKTAKIFDNYKCKSETSKSEIVEFIIQHDSDIYKTLIDEAFRSIKSNIKEKFDIDILSNPSHNGSYNQNLKIVSLRSVWIPFLFLCRQAVELSLKNALELTNIEIKGPTHNIKELWDVFVKENKTYIFEGEQCFIKRISVLVEVLDSLDNDGSHFRYSTSNNNDLYREKPYLINPKRFSDEVHSMALTLNCIDVSLFIR